MRNFHIVLAPFVFVFAAQNGCKSSDSGAPASDAGDDGGIAPCIGPDFQGAPLGVRCGALVDAQGRDVLLHGLNARIAGLWDVSFDDGRTPFLQVPPFEQGDATRIRALGFNALRLAFNWSGVEPTETGGFDEAYLDKVAAIVAECKSAGLQVLLDIHQDTYSKELGGDGAPLWAIVPAPTRKFSNPLSQADDDAAHQVASAASGTFFGPSADGTDGARLRQRFTAMAAHVLTRFANEPAVFGMEIYNEPLASDADLVSFYQTIIPALRAVAPQKLVLFEPGAVRNVIDAAPIGTASLGAGSVYAPHVYTLAFTGSTDAKNAITKDILRRSNASARDEADGYQAPLVITEFGFDATQAKYPDYVRWQYELHDEYRASSFYWVWKEYGTWGFFDIDDKGVATEKPAVIAAHARVRLEAVAGRLLDVAYDAGTKRFEAHFVGDPVITAPNLVSIGATAGFASVSATCDGAPVTPTPGEPLSIACGGAGVHSLVVTPK